MRASFTYGGEGRATGYLYGDVEWPDPLREEGPSVLAEIASLTDTNWSTVLFQAYADGNATTDRHSETMPQAILSLGATRTLSTDDGDVELAHGDVIVLDANVAHAVPPYPTDDERISLVFR